MKTEPPAEHRALRTETLTCDLAIVGGGLAGTCAAITAARAGLRVVLAQGGGGLGGTCAANTAARAGLRVVLIQDRPVLGGNASSEVRLWVLGATAHMLNNNRWAREGGVVDELLVENLWRNPEGNALIFDTVILEKVIEEPNITLLLNTAVFDAQKSGPDRIDAVRAFCPQNSTLYDVRAPLFCDASGDGIVGFLSGAAFRMGAESREEFGEKWAPDKAFGELLGQTIYFYSKDTGQPVCFIPPSFALRDITKIPRHGRFNAREHGCNLWWIEYGGRLDPVHDTERIKWELWRVVYGVWDHIKNSGKFPEAESLTLEWVGHIPGKRESRRFEGDYMVRQQDVIGQTRHADAVAFGGWSLDLHPADGVYSKLAGSHHQHARGIYGIPWRCLYSRNIGNLFLAGRIISASHVAFGSTRVMATCAHAAQAVGMAAAICVREKIAPRAVGERMGELQRDLLRTGQHIPGCALDDPDDLARQAAIAASSELRLAALPGDGEAVRLDRSRAQLLPVSPGPMPRLTLFLDAGEATTLRCELRTSDRPENHTPDVLLAAREIALAAGENQRVEVEFDTCIAEARYVFVCLMANERLAVRTSPLRLTGVLSTRHRKTQSPPPDIGVESFEFWAPERRPGGRNFALEIDPPLEVFSAANVTNGIQRPTCGANAWIAAIEDDAPSLALRWPEPRHIARVELAFDTDFDHSMESVLQGHPERAMPFCVKSFSLAAADGRELARVGDNHQTRRTIRLDPPVETNSLVLRIHETHGAPAALFELRCF